MDDNFTYEFPRTPGFLMPNGDFYRSDVLHDGHVSTAQEVLKNLYNYSVIKNKTIDPCEKLQELSGAIMIRAWLGQWYVYLPSRLPQKSEERAFLRRAVQYYEEMGYQIMNFNQIDLNPNFEKTNMRNIGNSTKEECSQSIGDYNTTVVKTKNGKLTYNPNRIGD